LIENLHQRATLTFFNENRAYDEAWKKWDANGRRGSEPKMTMNASRMWTSKVIQRCQQFITEYPEGRGIDEVTYQLAYAFDQLGRNKEAAQFHSRIVQKYPNSKRAADSHYSLGEFYFEKLDFNKALSSVFRVPPSGPTLSSKWHGAISIFSSMRRLSTDGNRLSTCLKLPPALRRERESG
jgi:tetratricopeptide (TPR) repeat protein